MEELVNEEESIKWKRHGWIVIEALTEEQIEEAHDL